MVNITGRCPCVVVRCSQPPNTINKAASVAMGATAAAMMLVSGMSNPLPAWAVPQTSACATESCDGFDYSNRWVTSEGQLYGSFVLWNSHESV